MKAAVLFPLFLFALLYAWGQNARIDSLRRAVETAKGDSAQLDAIYRLSEELRNAGEYKVAQREAEAGVKLARAAGSWKQEAQLLNNSGIASFYQGDYDLALAKFEQGLAIWEKHGDQVSASKNLNNIALIYGSRGDQVTALKYFLEALKRQEKIGDKSAISAALNNIGQIHALQGDFDRALGCFQKSLRIKEEIGEWDYIPMTMTNIGNIYLNRQEWSKGLEVFSKCLPIAEQRGDRQSVAQCLISMGIIRQASGDMPQALDDLKRSLALHQELGDRAGMADSHNNLSKVYLNLQRLGEAKHHAEQGLRISQEVGSLQWMGHGAHALYAADSALGDWKGAFEALKLHKLYSDSLKNDEKSRELGRVEAEFKAQQEKEAMEARQAIERAQNRWMLGSTAVGLLMLSVLAFTLFRGRRKEKRANVELRALNEEIQQQKTEIESQNAEITAQRDQLEQSNNKLLALDRMKEELTGMIVHDLKNPLNVVLGLTSLPPDERRLVTIRSAGLQMKQLTLNLLDVQKYEDAQLKLDLRPSHALDLLQDAVEQTAFLAQERQIAFSITCDPRLTVEADPELLTRVLVNLLTNAIKYAPAGDTLDLEAALDAERGAVFRVTDHGKGIPAEMLGRIFEKFSQVDGGQASGRMRSTGLGLTFCRMTAEAHGGGIRALSELGQYATFEFNIPNARMGFAAQPAAAKPAEPDAPPAETLAAHAHTLARLRALPVYELTGIFDLLDEIPNEPPALKRWKDQVEQASLSGDDRQYRRLLDA